MSKNNHTSLWRDFLFSFIKTTGKLQCLARQDPMVSIYVIIQGRTFFLRKCRSTQPSGWKFQWEVVQRHKKGRKSLPGSMFFLFFFERGKNYTSKDDLFHNSVLNHYCYVLYVLCIFVCSLLRLFVLLRESGVFVYHQITSARPRFQGRSRELWYSHGVALHLDATGPGDPWHHGVDIGGG